MLCTALHDWRDRESRAREFEHNRWGCTLTVTAKNPSSVREIALTEAEFIARFSPETHGDGSVYVQRFWWDEVDRAHIERAHAERRLWTYVHDGAGNASPVQGRRAVNNEFFILCSVPYGETEAISVLGEVDFCTLCGERFGDDADSDEPDGVARSAIDAWICDKCDSL